MHWMLRSGYGPSIVHRAAQAAPVSFDPADNSLEVVWTTGAAVERSGFFTDPFIETLEVTPEAIRLDRLNAGAAVLDSHNMYELGAAIGSIVPGSVRIANGQGTARITLADTPDVADTVAKVRGGHLRFISVGYFVHTYERHRGDDDAPDELRAVDWEPVEISFVTVPADPGAQVRAQENDMTRIIEGGARSVTSRSSAAPAIINRDGGARPGNEPAHDDDQDEPRTRSRGRGPTERSPVTETVIRELCGRAPDFSREVEAELLRDHAEEPLSRRELHQRINDHLVSIRQTPNIDARQGDRGDAHEGSMARRMEDALFSRLSGQAPSEGAREFMSARMLDMARGLMEQRGERTRWMSAGRVVDTMSRFGAHTTSDFPVILANAARRYLLSIITDYPAPLRPIVRPRTAVDFRRISLAKIGINPALLLVRENAEITRGSVVEAEEGYSINTYARIFAITRQALINDDLGAFQTIFQGWGRAAAELEASLISGLLLVNAAMGDGVPLYDERHGNLAAAGTGINVDSLGAARRAMRMQKDLDGTTLVSATPKFLVVGAAKETEAEQALTAIQAGTQGDTNPFPGKLQLLVDPRITGNQWMLFADPSIWPVIEVARLEGQEDVFVDSRVGFDVDGVETKARLDIGGAAVDWRGTYRNPGN